MLAHPAYAVCTSCAAHVANTTSDNLIFCYQINWKTRCWKYLRDIMEQDGNILNVKRTKHQGLALYYTNNANKLNSEKEEEEEEKKKSDQEIRHFLCWMIITRKINIPAFDRPTFSHHYSSD